MNQISHNNLWDFIKESKEGNTFNIEPYGSVVRIEERIGGGSHIGGAMYIHPGNDTLENIVLDCRALVDDMGRKTSPSKVHLRPFTLWQLWEFTFGNPNSFPETPYVWMKESSIKWLFEENSYDLPEIKDDFLKISDTFHCN